jgi:predicted transcriptional regulator
MSSKNKETSIADYTTIKHHPRVKYDLSNNDYCVANAIYHLSNNPDSIFKGWYHGKVETLGKMFNLSRASAYNSINKLIEKKLVDKNEESGFLRTTNLWWNEFVNFEIGQSSKI